MRLIGAARLAPLALLGLSAQAAGQAIPAGPSVASLADLTAAYRACWRPPPGLARLERLEQTVRFALRRDGTVIGRPWVAFVNFRERGRARDLLATAAVEAVRRCEPFHLEGRFADSFVGRPLSIHLVYNGPKGRGA